MKKIKLTKTGKLLIAGIIALVIIIIGAIKINQKIQYQKTYEYKLLEKGYEINQIKELEKLYNNKRLDYILTLDKDDNLISIAKEKYYIDKHLEEYLAYIKENKCNNATAILKINTYTNYDFYSHDIEAKNLSNTMIVNKFYKLKEDFVPNNLVDISNLYAWGTDNKAQKEVLDAFIRMQKDCLDQTGLKLLINSAYRSYKEQEEVYNDYVKKNNEEYADTIAARPGHSEHQTGLSLDIFSTKDTKIKTFGESDTFKWLKDNAYKYGFIIRYPKDKEAITGFNYEPWHYRYVGLEIAKEIYEEDITYEEYYEYYLNK